MMMKTYALVLNETNATSVVRSAFKNIDRCLSERGHKKKTLSDDIDFVLVWGTESEVETVKAKGKPFFDLTRCTGIGVAISTFPGKVRVQAFEVDKKVFFDVED